MAHLLLLHQNLLCSWNQLLPLTCSSCSEQDPDLFVERTPTRGPHSLSADATLVSLHTRPTGTWTSPAPSRRSLVRGRADTADVEPRAVPRSSSQARSLFSSSCLLPTGSSNVLLTSTTNPAAVAPCPGILDLSGFRKGLRNVFTSERGEAVTAARQECGSLTAAALLSCWTGFGRVSTRLVVNVYYKI